MFTNLQFETGSEYKDLNHNFRAYGKHRTVSRGRRRLILERRREYYLPHNVHALNISLDCVKITEGQEATL